MRPDDPDWWRRFIDGRYLWRGRTPTHAGGEGVDCWGLGVWVAREHFGYAWQDHATAYPDDGPEGRAQATSAMRANLSAWREVEWEEGAGVLFNVFGEPLHVGVATRSKGVVLHARGATFHPVTKRLVSPGIVNLLDLNQSSQWGRRFAGCHLPVGC